MTERVVFIEQEEFPYVQEAVIAFQFYPGFAVSQAQKSINSFHEEVVREFPSLKNKILEISTRSASKEGVLASAFNLQYQVNDHEIYSVESVFQAGKCFEKGGPYLDLLKKTGREIKQDPRLKESGAIVGFKIGSTCFPKDPTTLFYHWIYLNALIKNSSLAKEILKYSAFTDIAFNDKKSINCQARSAALYVSLYKNGILSSAMSSIEDFKRIVYHIDKESQENKEPEQLCFL